MLHEQAIYQHEGEQFQVEELDHANHKAFVRKVEPDYYTTAMTHTKVSVIDTAERSPEECVQAILLHLEKEGYIGPAGEKPASLP